ncbi:MAG: hypothetical protein CM15mP49_17180 [Actinomycetota bacterium]|nr:MAG: hypothetical protein CM15mP49_17180 [Actinomycetota bacterium]
MNVLEMVNLKKRFGGYLPVARNYDAFTVNLFKDRLSSGFNISAAVPRDVRSGSALGFYSQR